MRIVLVAVGRFGRGPGRPEAALFAVYAGRVSFPLTLKEVAERRPLPPAELRAREGDLLLAAVPRGAVVVALDAGGRALGSEALAERLRRWRDGGVKDLAFLIGGAEGLDEAVKSRADLVLSLGPMTWPHLLVRGMVAEQIYRADCILSGHPYHRS